MCFKGQGSIAIVAVLNYQWYLAGMIRFKNTMRKPNFLTGQRLLELVFAGSIFGLVAGCAPQDTATAWVDVAPEDNLGTVTTLSWSAVEEYSAGWVEVLLDGEIVATVEALADEDIVISSLLPSTDYDYRLIVESEFGAEIVAEGEFTTQSPPSSLPEINIVGRPSGVTDSAIFVATFMSSDTSLVAFDSAGRYRWWHIRDNESLSTRAMPSRDGTAVYDIGFPTAEVVASKSYSDADFFIMRTEVAAQETTVYEVPMAHHDMVELPDGKLAYLAFSPDPHDAGRPNGDAIIELDPKTGETAVVWTTWDTFAYEEDSGMELDFGWAGANALDFDEDENAYYVSARALSSITKIDRDTGVADWVFGAEGDFQMRGLGGFPEGQHQFEALNHSLLVFDNGQASLMSSRVVEYALDEQRMETTEVWAWEANPEIYVYSLGDVKRLANGNTLVVWSTAGAIDEVREDGSLQWSLNLGLGAGIGYLSLAAADPLGVNLFSAL